MLPPSNSGSSGSNPGTSNSRSNSGQKPAGGQRSSRGSQATGGSRAVGAKANSDSQPSSARKAGAGESLSLPDLQEVSIAIVANNFNPSLLNLDFLKLSGVVPEEWEPAKPPVQSPQLAQITFKNGFAIMAQPRSVTFSEAFGKKSTDQMHLAEVATRYVDKLSNADYQGVNIGPKTLVPFPDQDDAAREFITDKLLKSGSWTRFGEAPVRATINFLYQLEKGHLTLSVNEATLQQGDQAAIAALWFAGNFSYDLTQVEAQDRLLQVKECIAGWANDLRTFQTLIYRRFLSDTDEAVFPSIAPAPPPSRSAKEPAKESISEPAVPESAPESE